LYLLKQHELLFWLCLGWDSSTRRSLLPSSQSQSVFHSVTSLSTTMKTTRKKMVRGDNNTGHGGEDKKERARMNGSHKTPSSRPCASSRRVKMSTLDSRPRTIYNCNKWICSPYFPSIYIYIYLPFLVLIHNL
jgi:hypothetical protein